MLVGGKDKYQVNPNKKLGILRDNIPRCSIKIIKGADHWFTGYESKMAQQVVNWIVDIN